MCGNAPVCERPRVCACTCVSTCMRACVCTCVSICVEWFSGCGGTDRRKLRAEESWLRALKGQLSHSGGWRGRLAVFWCLSSDGMPQVGTSLWKVGSSCLGSTFTRRWCFFCGWGQGLGTRLRVKVQIQGTGVSSPDTA